MKAVLFALLPGMMAFGDVVKLKTGAEIPGKIESYSDYAGLVIKTPYGKTTIGPNNFSSFVISDDTLVKTLDVKPEDSKLSKNGVKLDLKYFDGYTYKYDADFQGQGQVLFQAVNSESTIFFQLRAEETGMTNKEYSETALKMLQSTDIGLVGSTDSSFTQNGIQFAMTQFVTDTKGVAFKFYLATFLFNGKNYKVLCWTYESLFNRNAPELLNKLKAISLK